MKEYVSGICQIMTITTTTKKNKAARNEYIYLYYEGKKDEKAKTEKEKEKHLARKLLGESRERREKNRTQWGYDGFSTVRQFFVVALF